MKSSHFSRTLFVQLSLCLSISGCGSLLTTSTTESASAKPVGSKRALAKDLVYVVVPGDTLRAIAVQTTGTTQNWDIIAGHNKLAYPYALRIDQQIRIPGRLLLAKPAIKIPQPSAPKRVVKHVKDGPPVAKRSVAKTSAVSSVGQVDAQSKDGPPVTKRTVAKASAVSSVGQVGTQSTDADGPRKPAAAKPESDSGWITITGSYYPREVKMKPSPGADYLMLVRPGSRIRYIAREGDWYKVVTDRGEGYVQSDYALEQ